MCIAVEKSEHDENLFKQNQTHMPRTFTAIWIINAHTMD